ncbi:pilus assembly protein|uniref:TadE-like protein n=1 Tax=Dendrosporobacter quercicolus TaxID=146817 RepID=A0A1H0A2S9_9FIRM|nr:TadE/TadG family type IV pilus assembly protein [Dendrosporobacter quercicolus]NSL49994.1 pilus assembly protein [Dendrosporobacter quercicolus DSM 1736]SDN27840.1 TadE-like protein [Dendrosporobacter quercicolus]
MGNYFADRRGQALVEFAIILPIFFLMLYALAYLGMFFHDYLTLNELTRDIARKEAVGISFDDIKQNYRERTFLTSVYSFNPDDVTVTTEAEEIGGGQQVTVTLTATVNVAENSFWGEMLPSTISSSLTMRKEE